MSNVRIGIIGAGARGIQTFGRLFSTEFKDRTEVVALADPNRERATAGRDYLGVKADVHEDLGDMLRRQDVDAVVVTTPDYLHEEACLAAFKHRKHVLVDKPLAITGEGCLRVIAAAKKANRLLYMGFNLRHDVVLRKLKAMTQEGVFGEIFSMQAIEHYHGGRTYMARWNRMKKWSGGLWIHKGSHDFDILNWFMAGVRPVRVSCFASCFTLNDKHFPFTLRKGVKAGPTCTVCPYLTECPDAYPVSQTGFSAAEKMFGDKCAKLDGYQKDLCIFLSEKDTHDQGIAIVEYENGATASHSEYFVTPKTNRHYLIEGTRGHGEADLSENYVEFLPRWSQDKARHSIHRDPGSHGGTDPKMCDEFVSCIETGLRPTASGIDGAWSVAIGQACEIAREKKKMVEIADVLDVKSSLLKA